jgi:hypothetical protein
MEAFAGSPDYRPSLFRTAIRVREADRVRSKADWASEAAANSAAAPHLIQHPCGTLSVHLSNKPSEVNMTDTQHSAESVVQADLSDGLWSAGSL